MNHLGNAAIYLVETIAGILLFLTLLRFWMQWVRADFRNPLGQGIIRITNPIIVPLRRILPGLGMVDSATLALSFLLAFAKTWLLASLIGVPLPLIQGTLYALGEVINYSIIIFMVSIFINIIASWINPYSHHPIISITRQISEPLMAPARRLLPTMGGLDFSPILVLLFLRLSQILVVAPLQSF